MREKRAIAPQHARNDQSKTRYRGAFSGNVANAQALISALKEKVHKVTEQNVQEHFDAAFAKYLVSNCIHA